MKCKNCNEREGTQKWVGEGGALAISHGWYAMWCKQCVLEAQLDYAKVAAERISVLERELEKVKKSGI